MSNKIVTKCNIFVYIIFFVQQIYTAQESLAANTVALTCLTLAISAHVPLVKPWRLMGNTVSVSLEDVCIAPGQFLC
jgi:hypothetical protein